MNEMTIGQRLAWARQTAGLSIGQAAKKLEMKPEDLGKLEGRGEVESTLDFSSMSRFASLYDVDFNWLKSGVERVVTIPAGRQMTEKDRESLRCLKARRRQDP